MPDRTVYCSDHPDVELRPATRYPYTAGAEARRRCPSGLSHTTGNASRCARCGGPMLTVRSYMAAYCGGTCRVAAHRAAKRAELARTLAGPAGASPGTDTAGMSPADVAPVRRSS